MTWLKGKELRLGQGYTCKVHNKKKLRLKGASKGINIKYNEGYLAMWLMIFKESKPQSSYQMHILMRFQTRTKASSRNANMKEYHT